MLFGKKRPRKGLESGVEQKVAATPPAKEASKKRLSVPKKSHKSRKGTKLDMYDMIIANLYSGSSIVEPDTDLDKTHIDIGFSNITSEKYIIKYFMINSLPDWLAPNVLDKIRMACLKKGVRINYYIYGEPHKINWDSPEMKNRMRTWRRYAQEGKGGDVFDYRNRRDEELARHRIVESTSYLNVSELDNKRELLKVSLMVEVAGLRDDESIANMGDSVHLLKDMCARNEIGLLEIRVNMIDWLQQLGIFSLQRINEVYKRITKKILTDDILANFNSYKQGRIGKSGIPLGIDTSSMAPVLKEFKENSSDAENILICGTSGSGKSMFLKVLLTWMMTKYVVTVLDYEGDEYSNLESLVYAGNPKDAIQISMGSGSTAYFDPMQIGDLTGDDRIDNDLKDDAVEYIMATFRTIIAGTDGELGTLKTSIVSEAVKRVYEDAGVTNDKDTWKRSKGLRISMVYEEIKDMVLSEEYRDTNSDDAKHNEAKDILESCRQYFEEGEIRAGTFANPIDIDSLRNCRLIVFSFGQKGADAEKQDKTQLALKQLCVANISTQISNYCKYVRKCFNVKVWEEYQRWGEIAGSSSLIGNCMTGGRKRGEINFIITNDLSNMIDESNKINAKLLQNLTGYIIGSIKSRSVREKFCDMYNIPEMKAPLEKIYKASSKKRTKGDNTYSLYRHSFCVIMDSGEKAIVKAMLPDELLNSKLFRTGVDIEGNTGFKR